MTDTMQETLVSDSPQAPIQADYFWFQETKKYFFPDGLTFIEFKVMNEGDKARFQRSTGRDIRLAKTGDAHMKMDIAGERHALIKACVVGWNLTRNGELVAFGERSLQDWLNGTNPRWVDEIEKAIRKANPWTLADVSSEDIQQQIDDLEEMKKVALEREQGEASSSSK